jgi:hypothetical protein
MDILANPIPTQTQIPGVELIYLEDRDVAGIHYSGLARLIGCNKQTITDAVEGVKQELVVKAEIQTSGGLQGVNFILEQGVVEILKKIRRSSRIKKETRDAAEDLYDRFAIAGFKLYAMLQVAPEVLKEKLSPVERVLPTRDVVDYANAAQQINSLPNGLTKQLLDDLLADEISLTRNLKYLPVAEKPKQYTIVKIRAKALGYNESQIGNGSQLGKFVRSRLQPAFTDNIGRFDAVNHYEITPELDQAIRDFFC